MYRKFFAATPSTGEGKRERAFSPASLTASSHATLLTGRDPLEHGILRNGTTLSAEIETIDDEFFHLARDPGELASRLPKWAGEAGDPEDRKRGEALLTLIDAHGAQRAADGTPQEISPEVRSALEALGYTQ
jgi:hypothetical protein